MGQKKAFCGQRIAEFSCARKGTVDIGIPVTSRNGDRKVMQCIRITSRPSSKIRKWNQLSEFRWTSTKVIPIEKTSTCYISTINQGFKRGSKWRTNSQSCISVFCSLSNISKLQLGAPAQTWQQYSMQCRMVDL